VIADDYCSRVVTFKMNTTEQLPELMAISVSKSTVTSTPASTVYFVIKSVVQYFAAPGLTFVGK